MSNRMFWVGLAAVVAFGFVLAASVLAALPPAPVAVVDL